MDEVNKRDYNTQERRDLAEQGKALPDGSFPIVDKTDLMNALQSIGRAKNRSLALRHIRARAKDLDMLDALPEWAMEKAADLKVGDFVEWNSAGGMAKGRIARVIREGSVAVPKSSFKINATPDDPAVLITLYREDETTGMFKRQEVTVGHKMSTLSRIEPLEKSLGDADIAVLDLLRPYSDLTDEQWLLVEDEVAKTGSVNAVSGYAKEVLEKAKQAFIGDQS